MKLLENAGNPITLYWHVEELQQVAQSFEERKTMTLLLKRYKIGDTWVQFYMTVSLYVVFGNLNAELKLVIGSKFLDLTLDNIFFQFFQQKIVRYEICVK